MVPALAAQLLTLSLGLVGSWHLGFRGEVRGVSGVPSHLSVPSPAPYELAPTLSFSLESPPSLVVRVGYTPRLELLSPGDGSYRVDSVSQYHEGSASVAWRAAHGLQLYLAGSGSLGLLEVSPLSQLSPRAGTGASPTAPGLPGQSDPSIQPGAGLRTARFSSVSGGAGFDWQPGYRWTLGATGIGSRNGGIGTEARDVFPLQNAVIAESHATYGMGPADRLSLRTSFSRTVYPEVSTATVYGLGARLEHRWAARLTGQFGAGLATSSDTANPNQAPLYRRVMPRFEAGVQRTAPERGGGVGLGAFASFEPNIDPYSNRVLQRAQAQVDMSWKATTWLGLTSGVAAATTVQPGQVGPWILAGNLGLWSRARTVDVGIVARAGYQERALPILAPWQWGVALMVAYWSKGAL